MNDDTVMSAEDLRMVIAAAEAQLGSLAPGESIFDVPEYVDTGELHTLAALDDIRDPLDESNARWGRFYGLVCDMAPGPEHLDAWFDQLKLTLDDIKADIKARNEIRAMVAERRAKEAAQGVKRKQPEP